MVPLDETKNLPTNGSGCVRAETKASIIVKLLNCLDQAVDPFTQKVIERVSLVRELFDDRNYQPHVRVDDLISNRRCEMQQAINLL